MVCEVEELLVDVDLAGVHQEVEVDSETVAEVEGLADHFPVEGEDQGGGFGSRGSGFRGRG